MNDAQSHPPADLVTQNTLDPPLTTGYTAAKQLAEKSRRRTNWLACATVLTWIAAAGIAIAATDICFKTARHGLVDRIVRQAQLTQDLFDKYGKDGRLSRTDVPEDLWSDYTAGARVISHQTRAMKSAVMLAIVAFAVAALLSVWLIIASRRSTLKEIAASLSSIEAALTQSSDKRDQLEATTKP